MESNSNKASRDDLCIFESSLRTGFSNSACDRGDFERGVAPLFIEGLNYHTDTVVKPKPLNLSELKLDYHVGMTSEEALIENMKKIHPELNPNTEVGLAFLSNHPALTEEQREKYRVLFYQKHEEECQAREEELIQTRKSCQSPVNLQPSTTTEHSSPISDII